jgi:S-formylglutathione hydrolase FrmB
MSSLMHINSRFRTLRTGFGREISGESAGGYGAMIVAMRITKRFSSVAAHSAFLSKLYEGLRPYQRGFVSTRTSLELSRAVPAALDYFGPEISAWRAHDPIFLALT